MIIHIITNYVKSKNIFFFLGYIKENIFLPLKTFLSEINLLENISYLDSDQFLPYKKLFFNIYFEKK